MQKVFCFSRETKTFKNTHQTQHSPNTLRIFAYYSYIADAHNDHRLVLKRFCGVKGARVDGRAAEGRLAREGRRWPPLVAVMAGADHHPI